MKLKIKNLDWDAGRPVAILNEKTAEKLSLHVNDRILIENKGKKTIAVIDLIESLVKENQIAISDEVIKYLNLRKNQNIEISLIPKPKSIPLIQKKLDCKKLSYDEIKTIIQDIVNNAINESEIAYYVSANYKCPFDMKETFYLTKAIKETGAILNLKGKIVDKHSIGGVAGNRTTPIIVSICSSFGLIMPKTSSRAITSAAGTADTLETITRVDFSIKELKNIIKKTNACLVWGGSLGLAPADDKIIRVEKLLNLDPDNQLLASIISKKLSVNAKYVLIDIPYGKYAKVTKKQGLKLKSKFEKLAKKFKIKIKVVLTYGNEPIGKGVGPVLEINDVINVLKQNKEKPEDLEKKSVFLAGQLLELAGKVKKGKGEELALECLKSGKAFKQFEKIIKAQKGKIRKLKPGKFFKHIKAEKTGKIKSIYNKKINLIARIAGCPLDKKAGIFLYKHVGDNIKKNEKILTIYSESKIELKDALNFFKNSKPIKIK